jgi:hypothetical protein
MSRFPAAIAEAIWDMKYRLKEADGTPMTVRTALQLINRFLAEHNQSPRPFVWRADPDDIIAARNRGFQTLESIH